MVLPASGNSLSLSQIQTEFGGSDPISLSEYYSASGAIPASGMISISDFFGASSHWNYLGRFSMDHVTQCFSLNSNFIGIVSAGLEGCSLWESNYDNSEFILRVYAYDSSSVLKMQPYNPFTGGISYTGYGAKLRIQGTQSGSSVSQYSDDVIFGPNQYMHVIRSLSVVVSSSYYYYVTIYESDRSDSSTISSYGYCYVVYSSSSDYNIKITDSNYKASSCRVASVLLQVVLYLTDSSVYIVTSTNSMSNNLGVSYDSILDITFSANGEKFVYITSTYIYVGTVTYNSGKTQVNSISVTSTGLSTLSPAPISLTSDGLYMLFGGGYFVDTSTYAGSFVYSRTKGSRMSKDGTIIAVPIYDSNDTFQNYFQIYQNSSSDVTTYTLKQTCHPPFDFITDYGKTIFDITEHFIAVSGTQSSSPGIYIIKY